MPSFQYSAATDTMRLMPQNYLVAYRRAGSAQWILDADGAISDDIACNVLRVLRKNLFSGPNLLEAILNRDVELRDPNEINDLKLASIRRKMLSTIANGGDWCLKDHL